MTDAWDAEPEVPIAGRERCSECEGWKVDVEDGICRACRILPIAPMPSQESPKWDVYDSEGRCHEFHREDEAKAAARYFGTTARRVR